MKIGSLFSGIGGLELGLEAALDGRVVWQAESDPYCRYILANHWPEARRYKDVREVDRTAEEVDLICGGFPCQDLSVANRGGRGLEGDKSGLWCEYARIIDELRPAIVVIENVPGLVRRGLDVIVHHLDRCGYSVEASRIRAEDVGAPHRRERLFVLGYSHRARQLQPGVADLGRRPGDPDQTMADPLCDRLARRSQAPAADRVTTRRRPESRVGRNAHGLQPGLDRPGRKQRSNQIIHHRWPLGQGAAQHDHEPQRTIPARSMRGRGSRIRALGNAVVPQVAYVVGMRIRQQLARARWVELLNDCDVPPEDWARVVQAWEELGVDAEQAADYVEGASYDMTVALAHLRLGLSGRDSEHK